MKIFNIKSLWGELLGSFLIAISLYNFAAQAKFPMTGFSGISIILYRLFHFPLGMSSILLNIPVAFVSYHLLGKGFFLRSVRCIFISSFMMDIIAPMLPVYTGEKILAAVCTGVIGGIGYALIYTQNSSTGGADFIIMSIKAKKPHIALGNLTFLFAVSVILFSGILFHDIDGIIYGLIINYLSSIVINKVMYSINSGKLLLIATDHGKSIAATIEYCCHRGSTILKAKGGYKNDDKEVIMCACNNKQVYQLQKAIKKTDPLSFTIILDSNEVHGNGFNTLLIGGKEK